MKDWSKNQKNTVWTTFTLEKEKVGKEPLLVALHSSRILLFGGKGYRTKHTDGIFFDVLSYKILDTSVNFGDESL